MGTAQTTRSTSTCGVDGWFWAYICEWHELRRYAKLSLRRAESEPEGMDVSGTGSQRSVHDMYMLLCMYMYNMLSCCCCCCCCVVLCICLVGQRPVPCGGRGMGGPFSL